MSHWRYVPEAAGFGSAGLLKPVSPTDTH